MLKSASGDRWAPNVPRLRIILGKLLLVLGDDVCLLVEDDEADGTRISLNDVINTDGEIKTYVVPQSRAPMNSPCFRVVGVADAMERRTRYIAERTGWEGKGGKESGEGLFRRNAAFERPPKPIHLPTDLAKPTDINFRCTQRNGKKGSAIPKLFSRSAICSANRTSG